MFPEVMSIFIIFGVLLIVILHFAALLTSLYCFKYGVNMTSILGFILWFFLGPFFWFYYAFSPNYCKELYNINPMS
jgi:hypothetical protein